MSWLVLLAAVVLLIVLLLLAVDMYWRTRSEYNVACRLPGERIYPLVGNMPELISITSTAATFSYITGKAVKFKQAYRFYVFNQLHYWPIRAAEVEFVFNSSKHNEKSFFYKFLHPILADGLLCSTSK